MDKSNSITSQSIFSKEISVILPVYNNEKNLIELCQQLTDNLRKITENFEIILVNDTSTDNSLAVIKQLHSTNKFIRFLHHEKNLGQHHAILSGINISNGKYLIVMDADLQDSPTLTLPLYSKITQGHDAVFVKRQGIYQSLGKMLTSRFLKSIVYSFTGLSRKAGTFFIIKKEIGQLMLNYNCPHPYTSIMAASSTTKLSYIDGIRQQRIHGESAYSFMKRVRYAYYALECLFFIKFRNN